MSAHLTIPYRCVVWLIYLDLFGPLFIILFFHKCFNFCPCNDPCESHSLILILKYFILTIAAWSWKLINLLTAFIPSEWSVDLPSHIYSKQQWINQTIGTVYRQCGSYKDIWSHWSMSPEPKPRSFIHSFIVSNFLKFDNVKLWFNA